MHSNSAENPPPSKTSTDSSDSGGGGSGSGAAAAETIFAATESDQVQAQEDAAFAKAQAAAKKRAETVPSGWVQDLSSLLFWKGLFCFFAATRLRLWMRWRTPGQQMQQAYRWNLPSRRINKKTHFNSFHPSSTTRSSSSVPWTGITTITCAPWERLCPPTSTRP